MRNWFDVFRLNQLFRKLRAKVQMPQVARFHLDESVHGDIAVGLRQRGRDCTTSQEVGLLQAPDESQLAYALSENRVIITRDSDFAILHAAGVKHAGILFWNSNRHFGQIIKIVDQLCAERSPEQFENTISYV